MALRRGQAAGSIGRVRSILLAALAAALAVPSAAAAIPPPIGGLTPIAGGCVAEAALSGCTTDPGAGDVTAIAIRPGGAVLYAVQGSSGADNSGGALIAYARNPQTGAIGARISCRAYNTAGLPGCVGDPLLYHAHGLALGPDGVGLYVTAQADLHGTLIAYATDPSTGAIGAQLSCFQRPGAPACPPAYGL